MALTTDDLVTAVRRLCFLPDASDVSASDILAVGDEEMGTVLSMLEKDAQEEYAVFVDDTAFTSALSYRLPRRALARTVRSVSYLNTDGREVPAFPEDVTSGSWALPSDQWDGRYHFAGDSIGFRSTPTSGWSLRVRYVRRPSKLVPVASCAAILKPASTTSLDIAGASATAAFAVGSYADIVRGDAPYDLSYVDRRVSAYVASTSIAFESSTPIVTTDFVSRAAIPNDRVDYVCLRDQTCYPPIAETGFPVLVAAIARRVSGDLLRDKEGAQIAETTLQARVKAHRDMIQPRNEQGSRAIVSGSSSLRGGYGRRWR